MVGAHRNPTVFVVADDFVIVEVLQTWSAADFNALQEKGVPIARYKDCVAMDRPRSTCIIMPSILLLFVIRNTCLRILTQTSGRVKTTLKQGQYGYPLS